MADPAITAATPGRSLRIEPLEDIQKGLCCCCGHLAAAAAVAGNALCLTCVPAYALDEPGIDDVATLIWLPHVEQGALSRCVTALHVACAAEGATIHDETLTGRSKDARRVLDALLACRAGSNERIGTDRPSLLRAAMRALQGHKPPRPEGETGLRVLTLGLWFPDHPRRYYDAAAEWAKSG